MSHFIFSKIISVDTKILSFIVRSNINFSFRPVYIIQMNWNFNIKQPPTSWATKNYTTAPSLYHRFVKETDKKYKKKKSNCLKTFDDEKKILNNPFYTFLFLFVIQLRLFYFELLNWILYFLFSFKYGFIFYK